VSTPKDMPARRTPAPNGTGSTVRFLTDPADPSHALYVIRLDLPDIEEYYT